MKKHVHLIFILICFITINHIAAQESFNYSGYFTDWNITQKNDTLFNKSISNREGYVFDLGKESNSFTNYHSISAALETKTLKDTVPDPLDQIMDLGDVIRLVFKKDGKKAKTEKKASILLLPNISYNPVNGLLLGISGTGAWKFSGKKGTRYSLVGATAAVTTNKQFISFVKSSIYTEDNNYYLEGDWRYYKFSASTFGLGTNSPKGDFDGHWGFLGTTIDSASGGYPMKYNYAIFHQIVNRRVVGNLYLGLGYHLDTYWDIEDLNLKLDTLPAQITPHYIYSKKHGFDPKGYATSGLSLNVMYDSRDNQINPFVGYYAKLNFKYNPTFLGSSKASSELWAEFRTYVGLSKKTPRHLLAFWAFGSFLTSGDLPYMTLMATGEDKRSRSGRGYIAGRYRGEDMIYTEVEYRFPITRKQTLGGVVFLNAVTVSNYGAGEKLFDYIRPAMGVGLRVLVNKHTRLNINLDFGIGFKSSGFYFAAGETF